MFLCCISLQWVVFWSSHFDPVGCVWLQQAVVGQNINDVHCELNCVSAVFSCVAFLQCYSMCFAKTVLGTVMCTRVGFGFNVHCVVFWH